MLLSYRSLLVLSLLCFAAAGLAQGGAGGYGQGGAAGGFGGGRGGGLGGGGGGGNFVGNADEPRSKDDKRARPDEESSNGLWESKTAILTPGDRYEIKLKVKKGETLLAGATSDAFDPALAVEDANKKVLAQNDDRSEGDQSPFVAYRFTQDGAYTLKVLSYRSVSGGKFTVKMRTFLASDASLGVVRHENVTLSGPEGNGPAMFRLTAKKGRIYDLNWVLGLRARGDYNHQLLRIIGPTGVEANDFHMVPTGDGSPVFEALADGDYYEEYSSEGVKDFKTDYREVVVLSGSSTSDQTFDVSAGELKIIEIPVKPNLIVRTRLTGSSIIQTLSAPAAAPNVAIGGGGDQSFGNNRYWTWFNMNSDSDLDIVRIFHGTGTARLALRSLMTASQKVTVKNTESLPEWSTSEAFKSSIEIGDTRLFLIKSGKSELMRVLASASHFQPRLDIFRLNGELANSLSNRKTHTAGDDLYFPGADTFVVRLTCDGNGGSGDFLMKRDSLAPAPYGLGGAQTLKLDGQNFGLYSVDLVAGKRYELLTDEPSVYTRADLLDDDGQFLVSQGIQFDKVGVQYFVPTRSGRHRLWLRGAPGVRHFKFELHVPPGIGG